MSDQKTVVEFSIDSKRDFVNLLNRTVGSYLDPTVLEVLEVRAIADGSSFQAPNTEVRLLFREQPFTIKYRRLDLGTYVVDTHGSTLAVADPTSVSVGEIRAALLAQYKAFLAHDDIHDTVLEETPEIRILRMTLRPDHLTWLPNITLPVTTAADIRHWLTKRELSDGFL